MHPNKSSASIDRSGGPRLNATHRTTDRIRVAVLPWKRNIQELSVENIVLTDGETVDSEPRLRYRRAQQPG